MNVKKKFISLVLLAFIGQAVQAASDEANYLSIDPFYIEPGEVITVNLNLINNDNICAYQTDLVLPEGLSVTQEKEGNEIYWNISVVPSRTSSRFENMHFTQVSKVNECIRIICSSYSNYSFSGNNGAITTISIKADEGIKSDIYEIKLKNSELTLKEGLKAYNPKEYLSSSVVGVTSEGCLTLAGAYHGEAIAILNEALAGKSGINVIDMAEVTSFAGEVNVDKNPNTLIYTSSEIGVNNKKNVVVNGVCDNLVLTDGYTFAPIESFTITNGTYNRTLDAKKYGTVILPFAIDDATKAAYEFYALKGLNGGCLQFRLVETPIAGVPYLYINKGEAAATGFTAVANSQSATISESAPSDDWQMKATYAPISFTETDVLDKTYYISNNAVKNATKSLTINPFRAYISGPSYKETFNNQAQSIGIRLEGTTEIIPIEMIESSELYDLNGRVIENAEKGLYIKNGKKYYVK